MSYIDKISVENEEYQLVGSGEVLPVGTELDIDKDAEIPFGWEEIEYDTGWVDLQIEDNVTVRPDDTATGETFSPKIRRLGDIVYIKGTLTNLQPNAVHRIIKNINSKFIPTDYTVKCFNSNVFSNSNDLTGLYIWKDTTSNFATLNGTWVMPDTTKRIKKVSETQVPSIGEVYDDQERVIGTWFGKPLYQKTLYFTNSQFSRANENILNFGIDNIDMVMFHSGIGYRNIDNTYQNILNTHGVMQDWGLGIFNMSRTNFVFWVGKMDGTNKYMLDYVYLTFRYTKTTDNQE